MNDEEQHEREDPLLRIGAVCAIVGAIITMAAGAGFGYLTNEAGTEVVLRTIASYPDWYWPIVHLGFIVGAVLWLFAFVALAHSFRRGAAWALGRLGAVSMVVGVAVHIVDSSISGAGLTALANAWKAAPDSEQADLLRQADTLLLVLSGTWANVLNFFSGLPFVLSGLAVARSPHYPTWLGYVGVLGGSVQLFAGITMFLGLGLVPDRVAIAFAILVSLWLGVTGILMARWVGATRTE